MQVSIDVGNMSTPYQGGTLLLELWRGPVLAHCWPVLLMPPGDEAAELCSNLLGVLGPALADHSSLSMQHKALGFLLDLGEDLAAQVVADGETGATGEAGPDMPALVMPAGETVETGPPIVEAATAEQPETAEGVMRELAELRQRQRPRAVPAPLLSILRECLWGFPQPRLEKSYRNFLARQAAPVAFYWSLMLSVMTISQLVRYGMEGRLDMAQLPALLLWLLPYFACSCTVLWRKQWAQVAHTDQSSSTDKSSMGSASSYQGTDAAGSLQGFESDFEDLTSCSTAHSSSTSEHKSTTSLPDSTHSRSGSRIRYLDPVSLDVFLVSFDLCKGLSLFLIGIGCLAKPNVFGVWFANKFEMMMDLVLYGTMEQVRVQSVSTACNDDDVIAGSGHGCVPLRGHRVDRTVCYTATHILLPDSTY